MLRNSSAQSVRPRRRPPLVRMLSILLHSAAAHGAASASFNGNYYGCKDAAAKAEKYCDKSLPDSCVRTAALPHLPAPPPSPATDSPVIYCRLSKMLAHLVYVPGPRERVDDIVSKLNLTEKIAFGSPTKAPFCACHTAPTAGLPDYKWLTETNSCVDSPCHPDAPGKCATIFVGPNNMAASFNRSSWRAKGDVVSTDLRAFNNIGDAMVGAKKNHGLGAGSGVATDEYGLLGLSGYGPNINVIKDPRCVHPPRIFHLFHV